jgi:hypothetical protein
MRRSSKLKDLGDLKDELRQRARAAVPAMCDQLGTPPFEPSEFELELVAHGDGAVFVDMEPTNDTLVFFPTSFPHEVLPVTCPSDRFEDLHFAINW